MMTSGAGSSIETLTNMNILIKNIIEILNYFTRPGKPWRRGFGFHG